MSQLFCKFCDNLLIVNTTDNVLKFECITCHTQYPSSDADSLRFKETRDQNIMIYSKLLDKAAQDPANPKVYKTCPKCKFNVAKMIRIGDDMKIILTCYNKSCGYQWIA